METQDEEATSKTDEKSEDESVPSIDWKSKFHQDAKASLICQHSSSFGPAYDESSGIPYTKGCKFSPDGLCILANASDNNLRLFELLPNQQPEPWQPCVTMKEGELIYDFAWYPKMDSTTPDTCCFASTSQYSPIHLYDAFDGHIRASYRCFDHLDEMVSARCVNFDALGSLVYAGLKNEIRVFDVAIPGKECLISRKLWTKKEGGQSGVVSCIATNPYLHNIYAVGTYSKSVGVYVEPDGQMLCILEGQAGGITHLQFSQDGSKLLAGGRKDNDITVWDMRNPGTVFCTLSREVTTHQRIWFETHPLNSNLVVSGSTNGVVRVWDLQRPDQDQKVEPVWSSAELSQDCVNGVSWHPHRAAIAVSIGQRHFQSMEDSDEDSEPDTSKPGWECGIKVFDF